MSQPPFETLLVANRGEIARRILHSCAALGVRTVAVASEPDRDAAWHRGADLVVPLNGATASETYLDQAQILAAAERSGAQAIHPGYGFLSENASFAQACAEAGVTFVGPPVEAIRSMGSKVLALEIARQAGVPTVPGVRGDGKSDQDLIAAADEIGFPVLVKASAGGGGRGMRLVRERDELPDALQSARAEARSAFGDPTLLLERYFERARHVEVQVLGDDHGTLLHLFERECSIQRRYQKIIEEAPSPAVDLELRARITESALKLAREVGYQSAGTVEFLLDDEGAFYFLEMNTRLQVEHPVTELVTGVDLVGAMISIASGRALELRQEDLSLRGHAIECRLYAEDPAQGFLPSTGRLDLYRAPHGPGVRCDDGVSTGSEITSYYDPMIAKIVTSGGDREQARRRMHRALHDTIALGVQTNLGYLQRVLAHPSFREGDTTTRFLDAHPELRQAPAPEEAAAWLCAAAIEAFGTWADSGLTSTEDGGAPTPASPFTALGAWRTLP